MLSLAWCGFAEGMLYRDVEIENEGKAFLYLYNLLILS